MSAKKRDGKINQQAVHPPKAVYQLFRRGCALVIKKCWMPFAIFLICTAILFSVFRALTPWAKQYKGDVEKHLSILIGQPVVINSMETSWYWFHPVLKLNQVVVSDNQNRVLKLNKLLVGIDLFSSIWHWHIQPGILFVEDVHLTIRQTQDHWDIDGLRGNNQPVTLNPDAYLPVMSWLLTQEKIIVKNVNAVVHLNDGSLLPFTSLNLRAVNNNGHYRLRGAVKLAQTVPTDLLILADMKLNPYAPHKVSGKIYVSVHHLILTQWQRFFPSFPFHLDNGKGHCDVWIDIAKGHVAALQTKLKLDNLAWRANQHPNPKMIQNLEANLAWLPTREGWQLSGDQINLQIAGLTWPENAMLIQYNQANQQYRFFLKKILIEPLLLSGIDWPDLMQPLLELKPQGQLEDTQIGITAGTIDHVLSRFDELSWGSQQGYPAVSHLSGVLDWHPTHGHLELDGEQTELAPLHLKPITFNLVNGAFDWKTEGDGLHVDIQRLILNHPNLTFKASGTLEGLGSPETVQVHLTADFLAHHATQWLTYVPSQGLKVKLDQWLKHDIKRIETANGQLLLEGRWADFPFDKSPGNFSIKTHLTGVDLIFNKNWPITRDIDAYLRVNKRTLETDIVHATMKGVPVNQVNLHMDDVGLDKETLLVYGQLEAPAKKFLSYIAASPLKKHLAKLQTLEMGGPLGLKLGLEVPLYPENDDVLAHGDVIFNHNPVTFHSVVNDIKLEDLSGSLEFDEKGVINSQLNGVLLDEPVRIHIQSLHLPKPVTELTIAGHTSVGKLRKKFNAPVIPFIKGPFDIEGRLTFSEDSNDLNQLKLTSSLQGVSIDLPKPFGKTSQERTEITTTIDFGDEKALQLELNYDNRISTNLQFVTSNNGFVLKGGEILLGRGKPASRKQEGMAVVGALDTLNVREWQEWMSKYPSSPTTPSLLDNIKRMNVKFGHVLVWGEDYPSVSIDASQLAAGAWGFKLDQPNMVGNLKYQRSTNALSGHFDRLYLKKSVLLGQTEKTNSAKLKPSNIPNLDLTIGAFKLDEMDLGSVAINSTSVDENWQLHACKIVSPVFQLAVQGNWKQTEKADVTHLQGELQLSRLSEILKIFHVSPVVDAKKGSIDFDGTWPAAVNDFSLSKVSGKLAMNLQDGRITHFSPETEEKLGLGKLLSILSLQTIPRRLKLDFSDLSKDGYSFDVFKGNFAIKNGVLNTSDSYLDGPVAYASMKGSINVIKQLYDLDLHISPHITASLPIVATIAGGPIAGIATWAASKIISQSMQTVTGYTYRVTGPWLNPDLQQESIFKKQAR